jgi:hypothetical protein
VPCRASGWPVEKSVLVCPTSPNPVWIGPPCGKLVWMPLVALLGIEA